MEHLRSVRTYRPGLELVMVGQDKVEEVLDVETRANPLLQLQIINCPLNEVNLCNKGTQYSHELDCQDFIPVYRLLRVAVHLLPAAVVQHPHRNIQPEFVFLAGEEDWPANLLDSPHHNWCARKLSSIITHQTVERRKLPMIQVRWCFVLIRQDQYLWGCMFTLLP